LVLLLENRPWLPSQLLQQVSSSSSSTHASTPTSLLVNLAMAGFGFVARLVRACWATARNAGSNRRQRLRMRRLHNAGAGGGLSWLRTSLPPLGRVLDAGGSLPSGPGIARRPGNAGQSLAFSFTVRRSASCWRSTRLICHVCGVCGVCAVRAVTVDELARDDLHGAAGARGAR
jgi:hypothetical protein